MAAQHQPHADDFDPYLQREDDPRDSNDWAEGACFTPSPVSSWQVSAVGPNSQGPYGPYQTVSTAPQDGQTPTAQTVKTEPLSSTAPCSKASSTNAAEELPRAGGWWLEGLSALFSIICIVAMVIVLVKFDGKLLSSWVWVISPNAVVSVLSTASKATMILTVAECISQLKWIYLDRHGHRSRYVLRSLPNVTLQTGPICDRPTDRPTD